MGILLAIVAAQECSAIVNGDVVDASILMPSGSKIADVNAVACTRTWRTSDEPKPVNDFVTAYAIWWRPFDETVLPAPPLSRN
jgi:hypothetical protein